ncbi:hypothetical protein MNBD_GAMMA12-487 [hydrothermal vent metagenome]|uniref:Lipoprotein n=1 Tax=hydrothermal vent metagenome TaxID=652676 RepID=A0A3B0YEN8_9ZZZZ
MTNLLFKVGRLFIISTAFFFLFSCSSQSSHTLIGAGAIKGGVYFNKYFIVTIKKPVNWYAIDMKNLGMLKTKKSHQHDKKDYNATFPEKVHLFSWFESKNNVQRVNGYNANILGIAERIRLSSNVISSKDYLLSIKMLMNKSAVNYQISPGIQSVKLGARDFSMLTVEAIIAGQKIKLQYYSTIYKKYALSVIVSWQSKAQHRTIQKMLAGIKFSK